MANELSREEVLKHLAFVKDNAQKSVDRAEWCLKVTIYGGNSESLIDMNRRYVADCKARLEAIETAIAILQQEQEKQKDVVVISTDSTAVLSDNEVEDNLRDWGFTLHSSGDALAAAADYDTWRRFMDYCRK